MSSSLGDDSRALRANAVRAKRPNLGLAGAASNGLALPVCTTFSHAVVGIGDAAPVLEV
jgi:hypothetical protein